MEWSGEGVLLAVRKHGESAAIIEVFTQEHGRHAGLVRGGGGRRMSPVLQPGAQLELNWRARLGEHLGSFSVEPIRQRAPQLFHDRLALLGLGAACSLLSFALPERAPHPALYRASVTLFDAFGAPGWLPAYLRWELMLLEETGFGLDLSSCAVTGTKEGLSYVSPRTGRAVSHAAAGVWAEKLLALPDGMLGQGPFMAHEIREALYTTGHFLNHWLAPSLGQRPLPEARARLVDALARMDNPPREAP